MSLSQPYYGTEAQNAVFLKNSLKPEDLMTASRAREHRISELLSWFERYTRGSANPKWFQQHCYELCYILGTTYSPNHSSQFIKRIRKELVTAPMKDNFTFTRDEVAELMGGFMKIAEDLVRDSDV